ncbi:MAG TPA: BMP family ABC transporter substrate-binding protein [Nitrososphaerales archaeon]|nr:BMP family ABC transporter substrate-binding protein [Nitrososphaerales archaeon]
MKLNHRRGISTATTATVIAAIVIIAGISTYYFMFPNTITVTTTQTTTTSTSSKTTTTTSTTSAHQYKLALVVGGDETDDGFNAVAIQAAQMIQTLYGWQVSISRDVAYSDQDRILATYAQQGYDVVWAHGGQFLGSTVFGNISSIYPHTIFIQSPGPSTTELKYANTNLTKNMVVLGPSFQVTGYYLAGVLAGEMTKTGAVGVIIGQWYDYLSEEFYAFQVGVNSTNNNVKVYARVAGTWADPNTGFQIAQTLITTQHVDIIAQIADATGRGVISAAQQYNVSIIGTVADQANLAPSITMTSVMMNTSAFIDSVIVRIMNGSFSAIGGTVINMNLGYLAPYHNYNSTIPQSVKQLVKTTETQIVQGSITVPEIITTNPPPDPK